jgi:hypothetical protein
LVSALHLEGWAKHLVKLSTHEMSMSETETQVCRPWTQMGGMMCSNTIVLLAGLSLRDLDACDVVNQVFGHQCLQLFQHRWIRRMIQFQVEMVLVLG